MPSSVKDRDRGYAALLKRFAGKSSANVTVGVHEDATYPDGTPVAENAARQEFGLGPPRRSFLADYVDENEQKLKDDLRKIGEAVVQGKVASIEQGLERFGLHVVGGIQQRISDGIPPENADSTIARKGSSTPLIESGILRTSIAHKVNKE